MTQSKRGFLRGLFDSPQIEQTKRASSSKTEVDRQPTQAEIEAFRDAMLPQDLGGSGYQLIPEDGTPEEFAEALIQSSLPRVFFNQINLGTEIGIGQLLAVFISRPGQASLEKDEIIGFVERNRSHMPKFFDELLPSFKEAAVGTGDEKLSNFIEYFSTQVRYAYSNMPERIDVKSDRLLWLIYALAAQVDSGKLSYDAALECLQKPMHFDRISPLTLRFMLFDYADSLDTTSQTSLVYVMLIGEAGRIKKIATVASAAFGVVTKSTGADEHGNIVRFVNNLEPFLVGAGRFDDEAKAAALRIRGRFGPSFKPNEF